MDIQRIIAIFAPDNHNIMKYLISLRTTNRL